MNIAVIYGGDSCERDVSVITAVQTMKLLNKFAYRVYPVLLGEHGGMFMPAHADDIRTYIGEKADVGEAVFFKGKTLCKSGRFMRRLAEIDCALLCTHGGAGENGALQGFLELCGIPYTSPGVEASAICMNKLTSKSVFAALGVNVLPAVKVRKGERERAFEYARGQGYPLMVKPARQGSSIGIDLAADEEQLRKALDVAFEFDGTALVERALTDFTEINCACVKYGQEVLVSSPERPVCWREFLTFEDKYLRGGKMSAPGREFPADLPAPQREYIQKSALKVYSELEMKGVVRFDFLLDNASGEVYLNEANTIPGSLGNYLWTDKGIDGCRLADMMIEQALAESAAQKPAYRSDILEVFGSGSANACKIGRGHI